MQDAELCASALGIVINELSIPDIKYTPREIFQLEQAKNLKRRMEEYNWYYETD